ncbi:UDP-N-acetylmuramate: L-alanyl-gamma-D-glutamyl-meso-diaminopimelate ligase [Povalibacter uvarum]|uniref:UDP-N-acetylmuramate--L-alanyl-gamma-D-glutamyl-meso-2,6-diaminoheptandioate ligase n=1 Tax=Povalibacter uvarum TaxID=732238 RepID=A0A841HUS3_9GAMM|nr:UDP-N-acetylmuramate:L-alanyl-gamma-D-glutamyl-meso-diaminopimelate ligase [Povalibacter uvarum]MBB6095708.1 UDP-N-acetylmuramate: L-alanyl-gamma-D-glutamyl-meso-diaminopimelate ligase [Povalibacter uvarum]
MHVHILGICGTFMGGIAALARAAGHRVTGSDQNVYPPMSDQLAALGIELIQGYDPDQLKLKPDVVVVGNVMSRGNPLVEALLESGIPYTSGPEWLARHILAGRWTLAVAGTHGKTTTSSILAWILEYAGLNPGFLIGGVPGNFNVTARDGGGKYFVVEADEYDTAFFDKRAKFVHYRPRTTILNNLEHDHADIYPDVASIQWQFHQLMRMVPRNGMVVANAGDANVMHVIDMGCWTPVERFSSGTQGDTAWYIAVEPGGDYSSFAIMEGERSMGEVRWSMVGRHNAENALAAVLAARHAGVEISKAIEALREFKGVRRRMEVRGVVDGITVYDDFAHHPTAIHTTIDGLRRRIGKARLIAVLEPRSNTMKLGSHQEAIAGSLAQADRVWLYQGPGVKWDVAASVATLGERARTVNDIGALVAEINDFATAGDHVLIMSNGGFDGVHGKLLARLRERSTG